jgi:glycosyltransferase involved in cell wall biosynthesis
MLSIITIVFNNINGIKKTLESISNIKDKNFEFIIIDGGSNDGTQEIISEYNHIVSHFITEKDKCIYDAMNKGIKLSNGEWIIFINGGDQINSVVFQDCIKVLNKSTADIVYGDVLVEKNGILKSVKAMPIEIINYCQPFCHQSSFVRRKLFIDNLFNLKYKICSDYHWFLNAYIHKAKYQYINYPISIFESGGISHTFSFRYFLENLFIVFNSHISLMSKIWFSFKVFIRLKNYLFSVIK